MTAAVRHRIGGAALGNHRVGRLDASRQRGGQEHAWLKDKTQISPSVIRCRSADGDLSLALVSLGLRTEIGWLLVCSWRDDFPTQTERLILGVAANQAVIGLQQAQLLSEQTRVAQQLDRKVRQRTKELGTANAELGFALKQIDTLRDDLQRENLVLRQQVAGARGGLAPWQLRRAEALMSENLSVQVPLGQVAEECGLSVRHLARAFRQSTGVPPHRWLLDRRVERAKELLRPESLHSHVHGGGSPEPRRMAPSAVGAIGRWCAQIHQ